MRLRPRSFGSGAVVVPGPLSFPGRCRSGPASAGAAGAGQGGEHPVRLLQGDRHRIVPLRGVPAGRQADHQILDRRGDPAGRAGPVGVHIGAAGDMAEHPRRVVAVEMLLAPAAQPVDHRPQLPTGRGEGVFDAAALRGAGQHAGPDEGVEPVGEHRTGDVQMGEEVAEVGHPVEGVAQDQQRPAFADHLQGAGQIATLPLITGTKCHADILALRSCQRTGSVTRLIS